MLHLTAKAGLKEVTDVLGLQHILVQNNPAVGNLPTVG